MSHVTHFALLAGLLIVLFSPCVVDAGFIYDLVLDIGATDSQLSSIWPGNWH